jgi:hypothetical protein
MKPCLASVVGACFVIPLLWALGVTLVYWIVWYIRAVSARRK